MDTAKNSLTFLFQYAATCETWGFTSQTSARDFTRDVSSPDDGELDPAHVAGRAYWMSCTDTQREELLTEFWRTTYENDSMHSDQFGPIDEPGISLGLRAARCLNWILNDLANDHDSDCNVVRTTPIDEISAWISTREIDPDLAPGREYWRWLEDQDNGEASAAVGCFWAMRPVAWQISSPALATIKEADAWAKAKGFRSYDVVMRSGGVYARPVRGQR